MKKVYLFTQKNVKDNKITLEGSDYPEIEAVLNEMIVLDLQSMIS